MRDPRPFAVYQHGKFVAVIHAYSRAQAQSVISARLSDTSNIVIKVSAPADITCQSGDLA
jgi:hypothetical protein